MTKPAQIPLVFLLVGLLATALPGKPAESTATVPSVEVGEPVHLEDYVVTGTRTRQATDVVPVQVQRIAAPEIERLGGRSFADAMEYVPGVQVESNCQNCNTTDIRLLGLDGNYNQIAFDGLPMLSSLAGVYGVEQVPADFIDRIEVVKGGGSSLYGASAVAGVVNIVPRVPRESGLASNYRIDLIDGGAAHSAGVTLDHVNAARETTLTGFGQWTRRDPVDLNDDGYTELTHREMEVVGVRGQISTDRLEWTADLNHTHEYRRGGNMLDRAPHLTNITEELDTRRTAATLSVASDAGRDVDFKAVLAAAFTTRQSFYGGLGEVVPDPLDPGFDPEAFDAALDVSRRQYGYTKNPLYVADLQVNHRFARRTFSWGIQAEHEEIDDRNLDASGGPTGLPPLIDDFSNLAAFVQDDWSPGEAWTVLSGFRVDMNNRLDDPVVSPRFSVRYSPSRYVTIRSSLATGFRSPRIFDEDLHIATLGADPIRIINVSGLKKENAFTANLGGVWNPAPVADRLAIEGGLFAARISDAFRLSELQTAPDGSLLQERVNGGRLDVWGGEVNVAYFFTPALRADLGFVFQRARLGAAEVILDDGGGKVISTDRLNKSPETLAVFKLQHESSESVDWAIGMRFIGPMYVLNNNRGDFERTSAFTVFDASIGRHFNLGDAGMEIRLGVVNLTDDRQKDLESGARRDSDYVYGPRQPRTYYAQLKARF